MNALQRGFLCALAAPALLFGLCQARPDLARRIDLDVGDLPEMIRQIEQEQCDMARIDQLERATQQRAETRARIADEVIAGRMGLLDAAARFRDLNHANPAGENHLRDVYAGDSDEERCCRQVIVWVEEQLTEKSIAEAARVMDRLEKELGEYLRRQSTPHVSL